MQLIDGQKIAEDIKKEIATEVRQTKKQPALAVVLVGSNEASWSYIRQKEKAAGEVGFLFCKYIFKEKDKEKDILKTIEWLNEDKEINGIMVQLPLPEKFNTEKILQKISPKKDVDSLTKKSSFKAPFIGSIIRCLKETNEDLKDKKILALVNSDLFGQKLQTCFKKEEGWSLDYFLSNKSQKDKIKKADVLISAIGQPNSIKGSSIKKDTILIDSGISRQAGEIMGDIEPIAVSKKAAWLAPVPGGVGPVTVALLLKNTFLAYQQQNI